VAKKPSPKAGVAKFAKKNHLKGSWKTKDADRDGLKNLAEFKAGTNPRKADSDGDGLRDGDEVKVGDDPTDRDSDGDGVKDGAEHAGTVTAVDGDVLTIRQFKGGKLTATLADDADCYAAGDVTADDSADDSGDDSADDTSDDSSTDDGSADDGSADDGGDDLDATVSTVGDDVGTCTDAGIEKGALLRSAELERDGGRLFIVALEIA
jgi:hypothetical protein